MRIDPKDAKAGDAICWKGQGWAFQIMSRLLDIFEKDWRRRDWKPWHTGYIVRILPDGEVVTSQAVAKGVEAVTYPSVSEIGECRIYRWLDSPDQNEIDKYTEEHNGELYDILDYLWVFLGVISTAWFHHPFRMVNEWKMCWENLSEFYRYMDKELQPEDEPCLISRIISKLEEKKE